MQEEDLVFSNSCVFIHIFLKITLPFSIHVLVEYSPEIVQGYLSELMVRDLGDRSVDTHSGYQERSAAADSDDHHQESLLVSENVSDRNLIEKTDPVPQRSYPLKKYSFSGRRSLRSYEIRR